MGKASRWFRGLLGLKPADQARTHSHSHQKKKWGFSKSRDDRRNPLPPIGDDEASRHAIAVATATAAVAEAAVAAAQAAAAVVKLTSSGRGISTAGKHGGGYAIREDWAAVTVQSHFRAYLSRRALRALKALVKLQALVRGHLVRKQTACALRRLQALVRAQARIRAGRVLNSDSPHSSMKSSHFNHLGPATPEKFERVTRARSMKHEQLTMLKRNNSKPNSIVINHNPERSYTRMSERSSSEQGSFATRSYHPHTDDDKSAKILEVDSQNCRSFSTTSKDSTARCQYGLSLSSGEVQCLSPLKFQHNTVDESAFCTADNSPAFYSASSSIKGAFTPTESDGARSCFSNYSDHPNYMAYTESSKAKARSLSAPRQRTQMERSSSAKRCSVLGSTQRVSGLHANFTSKAYPGSGRLDRLGMPVRGEVGGQWHRY